MIHRTLMICSIGATMAAGAWLTSPTAAFAQEQVVEQIAASPTVFVQERAAEILGLLNQNPGSPVEAEARKEAMRASIRSFLDIDTMAERTLGRDHWGARSDEERVEFTGLLRELIETSYTSRLGDEPVEPGDYTIRYTDERERRGNITVESEVTVRGRVHVVEIKMQERASGQYIVYDLVTDDVSLEESYAESFDRIIREHGWDELLRRMRDRLDEFE